MSLISLSPTLAQMQRQVPVRHTGGCLKLQPSVSRPQTSDLSPQPEKQSLNQSGIDCRADATGDLPKQLTLPSTKFPNTYTNIPNSPGKFIPCLFCNLAAGGNWPRYNHLQLSP